MARKKVSHKDQPDRKKGTAAPSLRGWSVFPLRPVQVRAENRKTKTKMKRPRQHAADDDQADTRANRRRTARQKSRAPIDLTEPLFDLLPDKLVVGILIATGDVGSVVNWSRTSRRHHNLATDPLLWRRLYETRFGAPLHADFARRSKDWQWFYRARACDGRVAGTSVGEISTTMAKSDTPALY